MTDEQAERQTILDFFLSFIIRGWGVMSLDDIPQGSFICCYIGLIVTDDTADKRGLHSGDNYMAELDYIGIYIYICPYH